MPSVPPASDSVTLAARVTRAFDADGPLARAVDTFEPRAGQRDMAAGVADVLESGGTLLAQAGTGTGKTMAARAFALLAGPVGSGFGSRWAASTCSLSLGVSPISMSITALARAIGSRGLFGIGISHLPSVGHCTAG